MTTDIVKHDSRYPTNLIDLQFVNCGISGWVSIIDELTVIKSLVAYDDGSTEFETESETLERLGDHPRIVRMLAVYKNQIVLERLQYPLRYRMWELREDGQTPSQESILKWSAQAAEGMHYFHGKNVLQVDVGLHNMLVDWDDNIKYCDFAGCSLDGSKPSIIASVRALPPNAEIGSPTVQTELFALGSAFYEMSTTFKAYEDVDHDEIQARYSRGEFPDTEQLILGNIIRRCWHGEYDNAGEIATEIRRMQRDFKGGNDLKVSLMDLLDRKRGEHSRVYLRVQLCIAIIVLGARTLASAFAPAP